MKSFSLPIVLLVVVAACILEASSAENKDDGPNRALNAASSGISEGFPDPFCFLYGSPVALIFQVFDFVCGFIHTNTLEDSLEFNRARTTLADTIYFTAEELTAVSVRYCSLFDFTDGTAFATNERHVWFPADMRGDDDDVNTATQLAHQMGHVRQYQRDFWGFKCAYFSELVRTGFSFDRDNEVEQEAFELEDKVAECIVNSTCIL